MFLAGMLSQAYDSYDLAAVDRILSSPDVSYASCEDVIANKYDEDYILNAQILRIKVPPRGQVKEVPIKSWRQQDAKAILKPYHILIVLREVS